MFPFLILHIIKLSRLLFNDLVIGTVRNESMSVSTCTCMCVCVYQVCFHSSLCSVLGPTPLSWPLLSLVRFWRLRYQTRLSWSPTLSLVTANLPLELPLLNEGTRLKLIKLRTTRHTMSYSNARQKDIP